MNVVQQNLFNKHVPKTKLYWIFDRFFNMSVTQLTIDKWWWRFWMFFFKQYELKCYDIPENCYFMFIYYLLTQMMKTWFLYECCMIWSKLTLFLILVSLFFSSKSDHFSLNFQACRHIGHSCWATNCEFNHLTIQCMWKQCEQAPQTERPNEKRERWR